MSKVSAMEWEWIEKHGSEKLKHSAKEDSLEGTFLAEWLFLFHLPSKDLYLLRYLLKERDGWTWGADCSLTDGEGLKRYLIKTETHSTADNFDYFTLNTYEVEAFRITAAIHIRGTAIGNYLNSLNSVKITAALLSKNTKNICSNAMTVGNVGILPADNEW